MIEIQDNFNEQQSHYQKKKSSGILNKLKWFFTGCLVMVCILLVCFMFAPRGVTEAARWLSGNELSRRLINIDVSNGSISEDSMVEMVVESVAVTVETNQPVVILKERNGDKYLAVGMGTAEINAIAAVLEGIAVPRPLSADLICTVINTVGGHIDHVVINKLEDGIFYANIVLITDWTRMDIDARPSDAISVALRVKAPIYVHSKVLDEAGRTPDGTKEKREIIKLFINFAS